MLTAAHDICGEPRDVVSEVTVPAVPAARLSALGDVVTASPPVRAL